VPRLPSLLLPLLLSSPAHAGVVINELLADPGTVVDANCDGVIDSTDDEFVEIVNVGPGSVDLSDATLSDGTGVQHTFPGGTVLGELEAVVVFSGGTPALDGSSAGIAPWCVDVRGRATVQVAGGLSLNNSGDTITLHDTTGGVLAEVDYGSLANDDQSIVLDPELIGPDYVKHGDGGELASPGSLSNLGDFEFIVDTGGPTGTGDCDRANTATGLVINELLSNAPSTDAGFEWIELYNGAGRSLDVSGYVIAAGTRSYDPGDPFPEGTIVPAGGHFVVGQSEKAGDIDLVNEGWELGNAGSNADGVRLEDCVGGVVDTVVYGSPNDDYLIDDGGNEATSLAPTPGEGESIARVPNGIDTDASGDDFLDLVVPTQGLANDADIESPCGGPATGIVVNELLTNPEGADEGYEWVELYHAGSESIDLEGWQVQAATSSWGTFVTFESGRLQPGEFLLVGGKEVDGVTVSTTKTLGNGTSNSDGVRVVDCAGFPVDTVVYGAPNDDGLADDSGDVALRTAPTPGEAASIQRVEDGYDTDDNQADWAPSETPTPGEPNPVVEPIVCEPSQGTVRINEFLPDPDGSDEGLEWVELYNIASEPVSIAGWGISAATSEFGSLDITFPGGTVVPPRGYLVVGGELVDSADVELEFSLGNGTGGDGLRLYDCDATSVDTVIYGEPGNEDGLPDDRGVIGETWLEPGGGESMARIVDGVDNDVADDWSLTAAPTPGLSNVRESRGLSADAITLGVGCGAGKNADKRPPRDVRDGGPEPRDPEAGCRTTPFGPYGAWAIALLALAMTRRRA